MRKIESKEDKQLLESVLHYVKAGGEVKRIKKMLDFCLKYDINIDQMKKIMQSSEGSDIIKRIRNGFF